MTIQMPELSDFDRILSSIVTDNKALQREYQIKTDSNGNFSSYIDIDGFIDVLYSVLKSNNYILSDEDDNSTGKFFFTEEFPDTRISKNTDNKIKDTISYDLVKRVPSSMSANAKPFDGTVVYRPIILGDERDKGDGGRILHLAHFYDNLIRFTCFSTKAHQVRKLATLFESILNKYYYSLRKYAPNVLYVGRGNGRVANGVGEHNIYLDLFVRTCEHTMLREQEINNIEHNIKINRNI